MFYSSQDAIIKGFTATPEEIVSWIDLRRIFRAQYRAAIDRGRWNLAAMFATQAQFYREALDAENIYYMNEHIFEGKGINKHYGKGRFC